LQRFAAMVYTDRTGATGTYSLPACIFLL